MCSATDQQPWQWHNISLAKKHAFLLLLLCFNMIIATTTASAAAATATATAATNSNHTVEEAYQALGISPNPDGSFTREIRIPMVNATPNVDPTKPTPVALSKDIQLLPSTAKPSMVRIFRPLKPPSNTKLPLIIYLHGGDFVLFSATTVVFHNFCNDIASQIPAIVVSVEYRLAPEHRLPAAYDDAMGAVLWARQQALRSNRRRDRWLKKYADFSRVFLMGSASGGNIAYHIALRVLHLHLHPLQIKGLIINQPFFGGIQRTKSEIKLIEDAYVPLYVNDVLWTLALPLNTTRDHSFSNPMKMVSSFGRLKRLPRTMIKANTGDPLVDRAKLLAKLLKSNGVKVVSVIVEGGYHGIELNNATAAQQLYDSIKGFIRSTT